MSKLNIVDLTNEVELSSAAMSEIGGGMSCQAGLAVAAVYMSVSQIYAIAGDLGNANGYAQKANGVVEGTCGVG
jgi:hypothetical protein